MFFSAVNRPIVVDEVLENVMCVFWRAALPIKEGLERNLISSIIFKFCFLFSLPEHMAQDIQFAPVASNLFSFYPSNCELNYFIRNIRLFTRAKITNRQGTVIFSDHLLVLSYSSQYCCPQEKLQHEGKIYVKFDQSHINQGTYRIHRNNKVTRYCAPI